MEEWKEYKLGDVCSRLRSGKGIKADSVFNSGKYPVIGGNGVRGYADVPNFEGQAAVIGRQGAYCGNVRFFEGEAYMTEHAVVAVGNELADTRFLACLLSLMHLGNLSAQSAQPGISVQTLSKQPIRLPSISYQKKVSAIIKSLDDKIEVNRRINDNLEQQAQALFKSWFVDFKPFRNGEFVESELGMIPKGWRVGKLSELIEVKYGKDHKKLVDGIIPVYGSGGLMRYAEKSLFTGESVLIPRKGTLNNVMYVNEAFWTVDTMFYSIPRIADIMLFVFLFLKNIDLLSLNAGSAVPSMTTEILNNMKMIIPDKLTINRFNSIVYKLYLIIKHNKIESRRLAELRDTLLPKLMSGELKVN
ncbi:MAG: restriction endonuclease subunit S [Bacteroidaceae bacterium]|nr:restriction endonuclease subunit S [Bacteroidaceae bacterium]MBR1542310.1 restriction endonuclease subunit S [Bacteroidaceae bacterium]